VCAGVDVAVDVGVGRLLLMNLLLTLSLSLSLSVTVSADVCVCVIQLSMRHPLCSVYTEVSVCVCISGVRQLPAGRIAIDNDLTKHLAVNSKSKSYAICDCFNKCHTFVILIAIIDL